MSENDPKVKNCEFKQNQIFLQGTVIFRQNDFGSKNEHLNPFLLCKDDSIVSLHKKGDNPFENNALKKFKGVYVQIFGHFHNNVFEVSDIQKIVDNNEKI